MPCAMAEGLPRFGCRKADVSHIFQAIRKRDSECVRGFSKIKISLHFFCPRHPQSFHLLPTWRGRKATYQLAQVDSLPRPPSPGEESILQIPKACTVLRHTCSLHMPEDVLCVVEDKTPEPGGFNPASQFALNWGSSGKAFCCAFCS